MYLLDTNHCSLAIKNQPDILSQLAVLAQTQIATCVIVQAELIYMAENSQRRESNLNRVTEFLKNISIYAIDSVTAVYEIALVWLKSINLEFAIAQLYQGVDS